MWIQEAIGKLLINDKLVNQEQSLKLFPIIECSAGLENTSDRKLSNFLRVHRNLQKVI